MLELHDNEGRTIWIAKSAIDMIEPAAGIPWAGAIIQVTGIKQGVKESVARVKQLYDAH